MKTEVTDSNTTKPPSKGFAVADEDKIFIRKWALVLIIAFLGQTGGAIWWAASISGRVSNRDDDVGEIKHDIKKLSVDISTALQVLGDHGQQFDNVDKRMIALDSRAAQNRDLIEKKADDRFRRTDWLSAKETLTTIREQNQALFSEKISNLARRLDILEGRE